MTPSVSEDILGYSRHYVFCCFAEDLSRTWKRMVVRAVQENLSGAFGERRSVTYWTRTSLWSLHLIHPFSLGLISVIVDLYIMANLSKVPPGRSAAFLRGPCSPPECRRLSSSTLYNRVRHPGTLLLLRSPLQVPCKPFGTFHCLVHGSPCQRQGPRGSLHGFPQ